MSPENTAEAAGDFTPLRRIVSDWYAVNPDIRRLWVYGREGEPGDAGAIHVVVTLAPVCDSDDISPVWLARCGEWRRFLQSLMGRSVRLEWFDSGIDVAPCVDGAEQALVCLATVGWRDG